MHHRGNVKPVIFNVTDVEGPAMLGCDLGLVQFNCNIMQVHQDLSSSSATQSNAHLTKENLVKEHPDRFEGLGAFKDMKPYHIRTSHSSPRKVPVCHRDLYKREIDNMLKLGGHNAR